MNQQEIKKKYEEHYFQILQNTIPSIPEGKLEKNSKSPCPDLILQTVTGMIGIEVTCIFKKDLQGVYLRNQESECKSMINEAICMYKKLNLPPVTVWIIFAPKISFNKKTRESNANKLSRLIASNLPSENSRIDIKNHFDTPDIFPNDIFHIYIRRYSYSQNNWHAIDRGNPQKDFRSELQSIIHKKYRILTIYKQVCPVC